MSEQFRLSLRIVNGFLLFFALLSVTVGSLSLHYAHEGANPGWPATSGVGVWAGIILMNTAILGLVVARNESEHSMFQCLNTLFLILNGVGLAVAIQLLVHPSTLMHGCMENPLPDYCAAARDGIITTAASHITLGVVFLPLLFVNYFLYFQLGKAIKKGQPLSFQEMK